MSNDGGFRQTWLEMFFLWGKWSSKKLQLWEIAQESARLQPLAPIRDDYLRGKQHPTMGQRFRSAISHDITRIISHDRTYAGFYVVFFKDVICPVCPSRWQSFFSILQFGLKKHRIKYGCDTDMWQNLRPNVVTWTTFFWGGGAFSPRAQTFSCACVKAVKAVHVPSPSWKGHWLADRLADQYSLVWPFDPYSGRIPHW